jgi:hypothetical protein
LTFSPCTFSRKYFFFTIGIRLVFVARQRPSDVFIC